MIAARKRRFWLVSAAAGVGVAATLALGAWQLDRAGQKLRHQAAIEERKALPPVEAQELLAAGSSPRFLHRTVKLRGVWDARHTIFLDNRQMHGLPGFYVVTPFMLAGSDKAVLMERGWVQRNFSQRENLPAVETPGGVVEVTGRIAPPPAKLYEFSGAGQGPIRQNLDLGQFRAETGVALLDVAVMQTGPPSEGLLREWPEVTSGVEKHYGYAFQWWALSALIAILYVWFQLVLPRRKSAHA